MLRSFFTCVPMALMLFALTACDGGAAGRASQGAIPGASPSGPGPLYAQVDPGKIEPAPIRTGVAAAPIVVPECRLVTIDRQEVPSQRNSVVMRILVKEGDIVQPKQMLAQLDDRVAAADLQIKKAKITASEADLKASQETHKEAVQREKTAKQLFQQGKAISYEEVRGAELAVTKYYQESISKKEAVRLSNEESKQSEVLLEMHQIKSTIAGKVKRIYKEPGEAVKELEPLFQIQNYDNLRVEGQVDVQYLRAFKEGMEVLIEPSNLESPLQKLDGHLHDVTGIAVTNDAKNPVIVSCSEDGTVRVWDRARGCEKQVLKHGVPVRAIACTPRGVAENLCLSGALDGKGRLWDLNSTSDQPARELRGQHRGAITCVAFTPDGKACATGGEDREIRLWDVGSGELRYTFPAGHKGAVTSIQFTPQGQLVSVGRDNTLRVWTVSGDSAKLETTIDRRSGDVASLGVSPDGKRVLFDQGKSLRILGLPRGLTESVLQNASGTANFTNFALFAPDAQTILTASSAEGRVQLWHAPTSTHRGHEICQFVSSDRAPATCAAFGPDGSFVVTGTRDKQVLVWQVPDAKEIDARFTAKVVWVDRSLESSSARQFRVWAELPNKDGRFLPGSTVTMVAQPTK
ncbi:MAG: HlyD family efflux transporter periplasmic adaptor subunit [Gemmataceae bacterium]|nr:HlyD family efflux transporter periplasmic adaptor subunit [Gemmataceae bacterium]